MTKNKQLSRRDAIKLLGAAAGATVLANLPSRWSKPELASGVIPAHAQTSEPAFYFVTCDGDFSFQSSPFNGTIGVTVSPNIAGISMNYLLLGGYNPTEQDVQINGLPVNPVLTGAGGVISIPVTISVTPISANSGSLSIYWTFTDGDLSFSSCTQIISWSEIPFP
jgi:hypothetical protein